MTNTSKVLVLGRESRHSLWSGFRRSGERSRWILQILELAVLPFTTADCKSTRMAKSLLSRREKMRRKFQPGSQFGKKQVALNENALVCSGTDRPRQDQALKACRGMFPFEWGCTWHCWRSFAPSLSTLRHRFYSYQLWWSHTSTAACHLHCISYL